MSMNYRRRWRGVDYGQALSGYRPGQARLRPATYYDRNSEVGPDAQARAMVDRLSRLEQSLKLREEASRQFADRQGRAAPQPTNAPRRPNPFTDGTGQFVGTSGIYDIFDTPNGRAYHDTETGNVFINGQLFATPAGQVPEGADPVNAPRPQGNFPPPGTTLPDGTVFEGVDEFGTPMGRTPDGRLIALPPEAFAPESREALPPREPQDVAAGPTPWEPPAPGDPGLVQQPMNIGVVDQPPPQTVAEPPVAFETPSMIPQAPPPQPPPPPLSAPSPDPVRHWAGVLDPNSVPAEFRWMFGLPPLPTTGSPPPSPSLGVPGVGEVAGPPNPYSTPTVESGVYGAAPAVPVAGGGEGTYIDPGSQDYNYAGPPTPVAAAPEPPPAFDPDDPSTWVTA